MDRRVSAARTRDAVHAVREASRASSCKAICSGRGATSRATAVPTCSTRSTAARGTSGSARRSMSSPSRRSRGWRHGRSTGAGRTLSFCPTSTGAIRPIISATPRKLTDAKRAEHGLKPGEDWDETIFNVFHKDSERHPPRLGERDGLCTRRSRSASPRRRPGIRSIMGLSRHDARGPRRFLPPA